MRTPLLCSISGCEKHSKSAGLCSAHYSRQLRHGDPNGGAEARPRQSSKICLVAECGKKAKGRNYCSQHYPRFLRYGDPTAGITPDGEPQRYIDQIVLNFEGDDCLIWPFSKNHQGYAEARYDGVRWRVNRLVCDKLFGPPPSAEHEAAHKCGKGHLGCVNKKHLRWATKSENQIDRVLHGTDCRGPKNKRSKLSAVDVLAIRSKRQLTTLDDLADEFSVSITTVSRAARGVTYFNI